MAIALYKDTYSKQFVVTSPEAVMQEIVNGTYKQFCEYLLTLTDKEYKSEKQKLPAVTWAGVFKEGTREIKTLQSYSNLVVIDVDNMDNTAIAVLKIQLRNDEYVRYCFISPSTRGVKFVVEVNTHAKDHRAAFLHLQNYFENKYLIKVDPSGKDVSRLCYVSYDPAAIIKSSKVFEVDLKYGEIVNEHTSAASFVATENLLKAFNVCKVWVERTKTYREGERNVYIHALACAMNRVGVKIDDAVQIIDKNYETPDVKWHQSVRSAYFHNQGEHGSVEIRDIGSQEFIAPPYIANFTEDVAANDLMATTAMLYHFKIPIQNIIDLVGKVAKYYHVQGYIDLNRMSLNDLMNQSIQALNNNIASNAEKLALPYVPAEKMIDDILSLDLGSGVKTYIPALDNLIGGLLPGNYYGLIGFGETFKSILAQYWAYMNAINDQPVLFLNSEMAVIQYYERFAMQAMGINLRSELAMGRITKETSESFKEQLQSITKNNIFVFSGIDFDEPKILATLDHILAKTGKKIKLVIMDGLGQMDQAKKEEAAANIYNSGICKQISKKAFGGEGVALVSLVHCSGKENKLIRNTGTVVRGGSKLLTNMDGYFSTSLFIDQQSVNPDNPDDINFMEGKFCLRFADKRGGTGVHYNVMNLMPRLMLESEGWDYRKYEVKAS